MRFILPLLIIFSACSTSPKNPGEISTLKRQAEMQLELGNGEANRGNLEGALVLLNEAKQLAIAADDSSLRIRTKISYSNVLFSRGQEYQEYAVKGWEEALAEAQDTGNSALSAVCRVHIARGKLLSDGKDAAAQVRDEVNRNLPHLKNDQLYTAFAWTVIALAEKELGNYAPAEAAIRRSLEIHEKDRYFELAAYDWFVIASCRSLAGNYKGAQQALENAISFDRRIENSWGLANDWRALGDVLSKAGDRNAAGSAYRRAAEIFSALGDEQTAEQVLSLVH